ncbi:MAG: PD-(D/E)XK nuclease family protein, partial [Proteobacteria bacterium]|nr:PD-(D/E)XK nuclease family protein [Pseudomonadota bacterium]
LLVAAIDDVRGRVFDRIFIPGLAERMFPQKIVEDPLLLDAARARQPAKLPVREDRLADERLALHLAIGAARDQVVLSYPRIDLDQNRPRVPSFYGLEVLEAAEGVLPGFDELARRADITGAARIGWPAPVDRLDAIDEAEHDLAMLDTVLRAGPGPAQAGGAAYLLHANPHLARALRFRARRWTLSGWKPADGFVVGAPVVPEVAAVLAAHQLAARSYSPTTLEHLAACPYRFALRAFARLSPRDAPEAIEALDPLERGSLIHEVQAELLGELRALGALPVRRDALATARDRLDAVLARVAARYRERLFPAIDRVWQGGIDAIRADLLEWLRRMSEDVTWTPARFELSFGPVGRDVARDEASVDEAVTIAGGLALRGSIDLVETATKDGGEALRASDSKTGRAKVKRGAVIDGGTSLQPILYALVLERLFPDATVVGGRLYYCTTRGEFTSVEVPLHDGARAATQILVDTLGHHLAEGFFPAAPAAEACRYCDFKPICGPHEERRAKIKQPARLVQLRLLRDQR